MTKQTYVILGIVLIILVLAGAVFVREKGEESAVTPAPISQPPVVTPTPPVSQTPTLVPQPPEFIIYYKNKEEGIYKVNTITRKITPYRPIESPVNFTGLPNTGEKGNVSIVLTKILTSKNQSQVIFIFTTYDLSKGNLIGLGDSYPVIDTKEFLCEIDNKSCSPSEILHSTIFLGSNFHWVDWDSQKNLLFGFKQGEDMGTISSVAVFDIKDKVLSQTKNYESAFAPRGFISPSLTKFIIIDAIEQTLFLYNSEDLSIPIKSFNIPNGIHSIAWTEKEDVLAIGGGYWLSTLNLKNGSMSLQFTDNTMAKSLVYWDFNNIRISEDGRYLVFVDYDGDEDILKTVKTDTNDITEIIRGESISLFYENFLEG